MRLYTIDMIKALHYCHREINLIHRDIKPDNILVQRTTDNRLITRVTDFGLAASMDAHDLDRSQTHTDVIAGTPEYMAPEQATSSGITVRTDLYSVGSLIYAMLTGRPPFRGKNANEVIESRLRDQPIPLDIINPELPDELVTLVHQLLEKDQANRPPTALAVMNRLKAMRAGLQKSATVLLDDSPTQLGAETSVELGSSDEHPTSAEKSSEKTADHPTDDLLKALHQACVVHWRWIELQVVHLLGLWVHPLAKDSLQSEAFVVHAEPEDGVHAGNKGAIDVGRLIVQRRGNLGSTILPRLQLLQVQASHILLEERGLVLGAREPVENVALEALIALIGNLLDLRDLKKDELDDVLVLHVLPLAHDGLDLFPELHQLVVLCRGLALLLRWGC